MSNSEIPIQTTQHAFLVAWGWFAEHLGLIQHLQAVSLKQKHYHHRPQTKVLEFLVAILAGLQHLQDISLAAHPLDKDQAVAHAWAQPAWADYCQRRRTFGSSWFLVSRWGTYPPLLQLSRSSAVKRRVRAVAAGGQSPHDHTSLF